MVVQKEKLLLLENLTIEMVKKPILEIQVVKREELIINQKLKKVQEVFGVKKVHY